MIQQNTDRYGRDSELCLDAYWERHKYTIANNRNWDCKGPCRGRPGCFKSCDKNHLRVRSSGTLRTYDRYIHYIADHISKPISEITFWDLCQAIDSVRQENNYASTTVTSIASAVRRVFEYAEEYGDAHDITDNTHSGTDAGLDVLVLLGSDRPVDYIREELRKERERLANTTKSLSIWQLERLASLLWERIEGDGRHCLICLMLYAGVRPAEGRALRWKDIVPFVDHPERDLINVYRIRDAEGKIQGRGKTDNAFRRIPVHIELAAYLKKRREYVLANSAGPIDELPICCYGNDFGRPCRDYEVASLAKKLFNELRLHKADMYAYQIEYLSERLEGARDSEDEEQSLTLYVLRRNFWTWLQSSTGLSDIEKRLIMGHELDDGVDRKKLNDENLLWDICCMMDHCIISRERHEPYLVAPIDVQDSVCIADQGICRICLTTDMLKQGVNLQITATTEEPGEAIRLESLSPLRSIGGISPQVRVTDAPSKKKKSINCEYETWQAHLKPTRPHAKKKENENVEGEG